MMDWLIGKWHGHPIQDDGPVRSREFKMFCRDFRRALKQFDGWTIERYSVGHYNCSVFLEKSGKLVYISHDVPRGNQPLNMYATDTFHGVLYRTATSTSDFRGGDNHFTNFENLERAINDLIEEED